MYFPIENCPFRQFWIQSLIRCHFFKELRPEAVDEDDKKLLRNAYPSRSSVVPQWLPKYGRKWKFLNGNLLMGVLLGVILVHPRWKLLERLVGSTFKVVSRSGWMLCLLSYCFCRNTTFVKAALLALKAFVFLRKLCTKCRCSLVWFQSSSFCQIARLP